MGILDNAKEIADLIQKLGDIDLYRKIVNLEGEIVTLTRAKREADQKVEELQRHRGVIAGLKRRGGFFFADDDPSPYCSHCVEIKNTAVHLKKGNVQERRRYGCVRAVRTTT